MDTRPGSANRPIELGSDDEGPPRPAYRPLVPEGPASLDRSISNANVGYGMLQKMGWRPGEGLGAQGDGRTEPVDKHLKRTLAGLELSDREPRKRHRPDSSTRFQRNLTPHDFRPVQAAHNARFDSHPPAPAGSSSSPQTNPSSYPPGPPEPPPYSHGVNAPYGIRSGSSYPNPHPPTAAPPSHRTPSSYPSPPPPQPTGLPSLPLPAKLPPAPSFVPARDPNPQPQIQLPLHALQPRHPFHGNQYTVTPARPRSGDKAKRPSPWAVPPPKLSSTAAVFLGPAALDAIAQRENEHEGIEIVLPPPPSARPTGIPTGPRHGPARQMQMQNQMQNQNQSASGPSTVAQSPAIPTGPRHGLALAHARQTQNQQQNQNQSHTQQNQNQNQNQNQSLPASGSHPTTQTHAHAQTRAPTHTPASWPPPTPAEPQPRSSTSAPSRISPLTEAAKPDANKPDAITRLMSMVFHSRPGAFTSGSPAGSAAPAGAGAGAASGARPGPGLASSSPLARSGAGAAAGLPGTPVQREKANKANIWFAPGSASGSGLGSKSPAPAAGGTGVPSGNTSEWRYPSHPAENAKSKMGSQPVGPQNPTGTSSQSAAQKHDVRASVNAADANMGWTPNLNWVPNQTSQSKSATTFTPLSIPSSLPNRAQDILNSRGGERRSTETSKARTTLSAGQSPTTGPPNPTRSPLPPTPQFPPAPRPRIVPRKVLGPHGQEMWQVVDLTQESPPPSAPPSTSPATSTSVPSQSLAAGTISPPVKIRRPWASASIHRTDPARSPSSSISRPGKSQRPLVQALTSENLPSAAAPSSLSASDNTRGKGSDTAPANSAVLLQPPDVLAGPPPLDRSPASPVPVWPPASDPETIPPGLNSLSKPHLAGVNDASISSTRRDELASPYDAPPTAAMGTSPIPGLRFVHTSEVSTTVPPYVPSSRVVLSPATPTTSLSSNRGTINPLSQRKVVEKPTNPHTPTVLCTPSPGDFLYPASPPLQGTASSHSFWSPSIDSEPFRLAQSAPVRQSVTPTKANNPPSFFAQSPPGLAHLPLPLNIVSLQGDTSVQKPPTSDAMLPNQGLPVGQTPSSASLDSVIPMSPLPPPPSLQLRENSPANHTTTISSPLSASPLLASDRASSPPTSVESPASLSKPSTSGPEELTSQALELSFPDGVHLDAELSALAAVSEMSLIVEREMSKETTTLPPAIVSSTELPSSIIPDSVETVEAETETVDDDVLDVSDPMPPAPTLPVSYSVGPSLDDPWATLNGAIATSNALDEDVEVSSLHDPLRFLQYRPGYTLAERVHEEEKVDETEVEATGRDEEATPAPDDAVSVDTPFTAPSSPVPLPLALTSASQRLQDLTAFIKSHKETKRALVAKLTSITDPVERHPLEMTLHELESVEDLMPQLGRTVAWRPETWQAPLVSIVMPLSPPTDVAPPETRPKWAAPQLHEPTTYRHTPYSSLLMPKELSDTMLAERKPSERKKKRKFVLHGVPHKSLETVQNYLETFGRIKLFYPLAKEDVMFVFRKTPPTFERPGLLKIPSVGTLRFDQIEGF